MTRVFVPATPLGLRTLASGEVLPVPSAYAATRRLAAEYPEAHEEELEFAAMMAAAEDCEGETAIVVAADIDARDDASIPGLVVPTGEIVLDRVASIHIGSKSDDDLGWYATQELTGLIDELG